jgi:hypothetical protein
VHRRFVLFALFAAALLASARDAAAQRIVLQGRGELATDSILLRVANEEYRLITADTVIAAPDTMRGTIVIAATTAKLENVILGDLIIIDANVFMRPYSRVTGSVTNIAGGLFRAGTARVDGEIREFLEAPYRAAQRASGDVDVVGERVASLFDLDGFGGFHTPSYDRVSGLSVTLGARYLLPRFGRTEPMLHGWVGYQTARQKLHGGFEAGFRNGTVEFRAGAERRVLTNDAWARGWSNSISYLTRGRDGRDYYDADRFYVGPIIGFAGENRSLTLRIDAQIENARSLASLDPWHATGDPPRPNPAIDNGRIASIVVAANASIVGRSYDLETDLALEAAGKVLNGRHQFARFDVGGRWAVEALTGHTFQVLWRFRAPLGAERLPQQRWSLLGGRATLFTLDYGDLRGDQLAWIGSAYRLPLPAVLTLPILGRPAIDAFHRIGNARTEGDNSELIQNVAIGLRFRIAYAFAGMDPDDRENVTWVFGFSIARRFPWEPI